MSVHKNLWNFHAGWVGLPARDDDHVPTWLRYGAIMAFWLDDDELHIQIQGPEVVTVHNTTEGEYQRFLAWALGQESRGAISLA